MNSEIPGFETPILFIVFNKPDETRRVFEQIRRIRPKQLFIAADAPRTHVSGELEQCAQTKLAVEHIDWPCEVARNYASENLGCKIAVSSAINWFFEHIEEGIILEDDCLPDPTFFSFCQNLLVQYRTDTRIKMISGTNFQFGRTYGDGSYFFSLFPQIWGWATWKRAWREYDITMKTYPAFKKSSAISSLFKSKKIQQHFIRIFDRLYRNEVDTWDGQWTYAIHEHGGLTIIPNINLISNIGYVRGATHTHTHDIFSNIPTQSMGTIIHPSKIEVRQDADEYYSSLIIKSFPAKVLDRLRSILSQRS